MCSCACACLKGRKYCVYMVYTFLVDMGWLRLVASFKYIGLFCRIFSLFEVCFAKEIHTFKEPTSRSQPIRQNISAYSFGVWQIHLQPDGVLFGHYSLSCVPLICTYTCLRVCVRVRACVCVCLCVCVYACTHKDTDIHIRTFVRSATSPPMVTCDTRKSHVGWLWLVGSLRS